MATREKKARSLTSDSPTPFLLASTNSGSNTNLTVTTSTSTSSTISPSTAGNGTTGNTLTLAETGASGTSGGGSNNGSGGSASAPTTPTSSRKGTIASVHGGSNSSLASTGAATSGSNTSSNTRASLSRQKSKQQLVSSNIGDESGATGEEPLVTGESSSLVPASPSSSTRTTRGGASRETETSPASAAGAGSTSASNISFSSSDVSASLTSKERDDMMPSPSWSSSSSKDRTKSPAIGARRAAAATKVATTSTTSTSASSSASVVVTSTISTRADRRHQVKGGLKRAALLKRKAGRKIIGKPVLGKKGVVRRKLAVAVKATRAAAAAAAAVENVTEKDSKSIKDEEMIERTTPSLRNGKPRNSDSPVPKRRAAQKSPDNSWPTSPSGKIQRRRSVCVSKLVELDEEPERPTDTDMKTKSFVLDKMSETFNERKAPGGGGVSPAISERGGSGSTLRRSTRQRKSTARDKEEFLSPRLKGAGSGSAIEIKMELVDQCDAGEEEIAVAIESDSISTSLAAAAAAPLTIDTAVVIDDDSIKDGPHSDGTVSIASTSGTGDVAVVVMSAVVASTGELVVEKDISSSLSPELVSEGVSELSVKECYGEPAFLENNLGIEKDPKLGEIVQERFRCDKVSGEDVDKDASAVACEELVKVKEEAKEKELEKKEQVPSATTSGGGGGGGDSGDGDRVDVAGVDGGGSVGDKQQAANINGKTIECEKEKVIAEDQDIVMVVKEELEPENETQSNVMTEVQEGTSQNAEPMIVDQPVVCEKEDQSDKLDKSECSVSLVEKPKEPIDEEMPEVITVEDKEIELNGATEESAVTVTNDGEAQAEEQSTSLSLIPSVELPTDVVIIDDAEEDEVDSTVKELPHTETDCKGSATDGAKSSDSSPNVVDTSSIESTDKRASVSPSTIEGAKINGESGESDATDSDKQSSNQHLQVTAQKHTPSAKQSSPSGTNLGGSRATTPKPSKTSSASATSGSSSKESKTKTRTTKEKTKEDEKTREEKLRQEKLRVEEKVREEKLRAERLLQQEAEQRLKEGSQKKTKEISKGAVENGIEEEDPTSHASNPSSPKQFDETEKKTESATATESAVKMISIGSLSLPAITLLKKDNGVASATFDTSSSADSPAATAVEAEPVSGKSNRSRSSSRSSPSGFGRNSKDEKPPNKQQAESPIPIGAKSEHTGTAVARETSSSNKLEVSATPSLTVVKIEKNEDCDEQHHKDEKKLKDIVLPVVLLEESDDAAKLKESHLKHLGLLTLQAASEEKQRLADLKPATPMTAGDLLRDDAAAGGGGASGGGEGWLADSISKSTGGAATGSNSSTVGGRGGNKSTRTSKDEYTVSMKTVQQKGGSGSGRGGEKRKQQRMPLKMTFQKGKGKGSGRDSSSNGSSGVSSNGGGGGSGGSGSSASGYATDSGTNNGGDYYTIHSNEADHHSSNSCDGHGHREGGGAGGRKTHSRSHTTDGVNLTEAIGEPPSTKEVIQKALVIPEKASSFKVHPDRLCQDQCFYCGGKFGLYDTPCHIAAIKSADRQQKILLAESKITLDSCLCDACFRHVDRKANCPSQKKKVTSTVTSNEGTSLASTATTTTTTTKTTQQQSTVTPIVIKMTTNKDGSTSITGQQQQQQQPSTVSEPTHHGVNKVHEICAVRHCTANAMQSLRRRWVMKMKRKIGKHLDINLDHKPKHGNADCVSICNKHYEQIDHLMICAMCTRQLQRNQVYHMFNNIPQLERLIQEQGIPGVRLSSSELVVCKICRYYANLLLKPPPDVNPQKSQFIANYNRRLYNARNRNNEPEEVMIQAVDPASVVSCRQSSSNADIVISDGDEEEAAEEGEEEEEEEAYPDGATLALQQQQQQQQPFQSVAELFSIGDNSVSLRRRVNPRKSPDVSIVENNGSVVAAAMGDLGEISILPATKPFNASTTAPQQVREDDNIDMTKVLKSNPNISMRELFPGEEDLGIHVNIPFSSATMRTPEGWTKVTTTVQYDDSTRALWEELQEPYGNQSSFLRHLLLLERYFRNGELVLSPMAKTNASSYAEAMQSRLRSYDNKPSAVSSPPALASLSPTASSLATGGVQLDKASNILQQFSNSTITIVPTSRVRGGNKAASVADAAGQSANSAGLTVTPQQALLVSEATSPPASTPAAPVSLLKSNNLHLANSHQQEQTLAGMKRKISTDGGTKASIVPAATSSPHTSAGASKVAKLDEPKGVGAAATSMPPELICLNRKPSVTITTIPASRPAPTNQPQQQQSLLQQQSSTPSLQQEQQQQQTANQSPADKVAATATGTANREIIHMPDKLTEAERRESSRTWRPTLLAIVPGVTESLKTEPLYKTADGRLLPRLVQVMSGGKQYHISINDYNRMCILRREKLIQQQLLSGNKRVPPGVGPQQQQQQQTTPNKGSQTSSPVASSPPSVSPAAVTSIPNLRLSVSSDGSFTGGPKMVQIPNQILEQNSLIPLPAAGTTTPASSSSAGSSAKQYGGPTNASGGSVSAKKSINSSLMVTMTSANNNNNNLTKQASNTSGNSSALKSLSLPNSTTVYPMTITANSITLPSATGVSMHPALPVNNQITNPSLLALSQASALFAASVTNASPAMSMSSTHHNVQMTLNNSNHNPSAPAVSSPALPNPLDQLLQGGCSSLVSQAQLQAFMNAYQSNSGLGAASSMANEHSAAQLLSKIPKSLTVIPQQKQRSMSRVSSNEDQNSA
uniref:Putative secreted mucin n=1 Tax=Anopheles marajoara TaxID=58244 RepID=A0A2M4B7Z0_9DIPT